MTIFRYYFQYKSFYAASSDTAKSKSYFVESVDLNQDGYKEIIFFGATYPIGSNTTDSSQNGMFYWGTNDYKYSITSQLSLSLPKTTHPREIAYADFNNDGKLDIFIADHGWDTIPFPGAQNQLILSSPAGWVTATLNLPQRQDFTHSTAVGDINNDGFLDIYLGNINTGSSPYNSSILLGDGTGKFTESISVLPSELTGKDAIRSTSAQFSDLNSDGWQDLVIGNDGNVNNSKTQSIVYWNDRGKFTNSHFSLIPNGYFGIKNEQILDAQTGDLDGDGIKEIVLLSTQNIPFYDGWNLQALKLSGEKISDFTTSAFGENIHKMGIPNKTTSSPWITFIKLVDVNKDGTLDILFDGIQMGNSIDQSTMPILYLNDGFAHFSPIFAGDLLKAFPEKEIGSPFNDFFNQASVFLGSDGLSWLSQFVMDGKVYFRELLPTKPLPKISTITATTGADTVIGNELDNTLFGLAGNDLLVGGLGNDIIDGGSGLDTVRVDDQYGSEAARNYSLEKLTDGSWNVSFIGPTIAIYPPPVTNGSDKLINVERLRFTDKSFALDLDGAAGISAKVIGAVLGKTQVQNPTFVGLGLSYLDKGMSYSDLGALAMTAVGSTTNDAVVSTLWRNVVGFDASSEQKAPYIKMLSDGMKVGDLVVLAADTSFNTTNINLVGLAQTGIEYIPVI